MASKNLLLTHFNVKTTEINNAILAWKKIYSENDNCLYVERDSNSPKLLMISEIDTVNTLDSIIFSNEQALLEEELKTILMSDWSRQIITIKDQVKPLEQKLPNTEFLQLRHIEVPLRVYKEYLIWREKTIFQHVKQQEKIDFFLAYHSVMSTEPGVMFLSGFSCPIEEYLMLFNNLTYQNIVKEAGEKYISNGEKGLYTKLYKRV